MTFLIGLLTPLLEWCVQKLVNWGLVEIESIVEKMRLASQAKADGQALKDAKTDDEQKAAIDKTIDDTFNPKL